MAIIDSYSKLYYPAVRLQDVGFCLMTTTTVDGISGFGTSEKLSLKNLTAPIRVPGIEVGEDEEGLVDINALSGSEIAVQLELNRRKQGEATLILDGAALVSKNGPSLEGRSRSVKLMKLAVYAGLYNSLASGNLTSITVILKNLPNQNGITEPLPDHFGAPFTSKSSPEMKKLEADLKVNTSIDCG